jgi:hypothetical protein
MDSRLRVLLLACAMTAAAASASGQAFDPFAGGPTRLVAGNEPLTPFPVAPPPAYEPIAPPPQTWCGLECLPPCCLGCWQFDGDFLYLRPGQDRVPYAVPINGAIIPPVGVAPIQVGRIAAADVDFGPGFRVGMSRSLDECSRLGVAYSYFDSSYFDQVNVDAPIVLRSMVAHPGTQAAPTNFLSAQADASIRFQLGDVDYRHTWLCNERMSFGYLVGARYAHLEQGFGSLMTNSTTQETVDTKLLFDGGGIRFGLEGQRQALCSGFGVYGSAIASFVGGRFEGDYIQADNFSGTVVSTGWRDDRIIPILDLELGVSWTSCGNRLRVSCGYLFSAWFNMPKTQDFINSIQTNNLPQIQDALTFDGMALRTEFRY